MNKKRTALQALVGQQERAERAMSQILKIPYGDYNKRAGKGGQRHDADFQGRLGSPRDPQMPGTADRMPGTTGTTLTQPNLMERVLDALKIKKFKPKLVPMKPPTKRPNPMPGVT